MKSNTTKLMLILFSFCNLNVFGQLETNRPATQEEMAFEKSIKAKLYELISKSVSFSDYELVVDELNTQPNPVAYGGAELVPYLFDMKLTWELKQGTDTWQKMQDMQVSEAQEMMRLSSSGSLPKNTCLFKSGEYQTISINVKCNWKENDRPLTVLNNIVKIDSNKFLYFLKSDNCIPGGNSETNTCSNEIHLFFGTLEKVNTDYAYLDNNKEIGKSLEIIAKYNQRIPYLKLQSLFIIINAPKEFADIIFTKLDKESIKQLLAY